MAANGISTLVTKELKIKAKLELASKKRQGYTLDVIGVVEPNGTADTSKPFYRALNQYDITALPSQYSNNSIVDNPNVGGLVNSRPWYSNV